MLFTTVIEMIEKKYYIVAHGTELFSQNKQKTRLKTIICQDLAIKYLFKVNNRKRRRRCKMGSELARKNERERLQWLYYNEILILLVIVLGY